MNEIPALKKRKRHTWITPLLFEVLCQCANLRLSLVTNATFRLRFFSSLSLFSFYLQHNNYKKYRRRGKKKWRGDLTETIGAYERLGLLELRARAVSHQLKKRWREVENGRIYKLFSYLLNNLIFSFFLREERDWELMTSLSSELKNLGSWKKGENLLVFVQQYGRR